MLPFFVFSDTKSSISLVKHLGKKQVLTNTNDSLEDIRNITNKCHNAIFLTNDTILQHFLTLLETIFTGIKQKGFCTKNLHLKHIYVSIPKSSRKQGHCIIIN